MQLNQKTAIRYRLRVLAQACMLQGFSITKMRAFQLSLSLFLFVSLSTNAQTIKNSISFSGENVPLCKIFPVIEEQCGYTVMYNQQLLSSSHPVNLKVNNMSLYDFLELAFKDQPLQFRIGDRTIFLSEKATFRPLIVAAPIDTTYVIHGVIYDGSTSKPLIGVTVMTQKNGKGAQTDVNGEFNISKLSGPDVITMSFIGYQTIKMKITGSRANISTVMMPATGQLDQVVVQGYGVTSRRLATGSITKVTGEEIARQAVSNPLMALQGKVPGMIITPNNGHSSANMRVEVRGRNSLGFSAITEPLYMVDGVPFNTVNVTPPVMGMSGGTIQGGYSNVYGQSPLFSINPRDIESIEVLKDADATAIYGSRGANGVVIITTKKAKPGKTSFVVDYTDGWTTPSRRIPLMKTAEYLAMRREAFANDNITPTKENAPDLMAWDTTRYTDWQKQMVGTGRQQEISVGLNGGDANTMFRLNVNYGKIIDLMNQSGGNKRGTISFNLDHNTLNNKLRMSLMANYSFNSVDAINLSGNLAVFVPNAPPIFDKLGNLNFAEWNYGDNSQAFPFAYLLTPSKTKNNSLLTSLSVSYELVKGLRAIMVAGVTQNNGTSHMIMPIAAQNPAYGATTGMANFGTTNTSNINTDLRLDYSRVVAKGQLTAQIGGTYQPSTTTASTTEGTGYQYDELLNSITNAAAQRTSELKADFKYAGMFARLTYDWQHKYIFNFNARRDGSSRFAPGKQFGNFGSAAAAWTFSEESWLKERLPDWVNMLKLRVSYGVTGSDGSMDYQYMKEWAAKDPDYSNVPLYNYNGIKPYLLQHAFNDQYQWEATRQINWGADIALFNERLIISADYYRKRTDNQLTQFPTPIITGFPYVLGNWAANVRNTGIDASVLWTVINKPDLKLSVSANIGANKNILLAYDGIETSPYALTYKVGKSLSTMYLLHYLGVDPRTGKYAYEDANKDGRISTDGSLQVPNSDDRVVERDMTPAYAGGGGINLIYKSFNFNTSFSFRKQYAQNLLSNMRPGRMESQYIPPDYQNNRWRKPGDIALYGPYSTNPDIMGESDMTYSNASFLKINNVAIGYNLPNSFVKKAGMQSCNVMVSMNNIFWITSFRGVDPELANYSSIPTARVITGRINFTF